MTGDTELIAVLADRLEPGETILVDSGIVLIRQETNRPLYGISVDGDLINVFDSSEAAATAAMGRKLRAVAAQYRSEEENTDAVVSDGVEIDYPGVH